ncbi:hypothetical protein [Engelhardtia mirabilis]|uniref:Uncharacterized protein n=1 Tax=Engelhardtia mirabilis TaxID=2528011 RepID=A0A518BM30_9BACT|nr:hypothetical protein Pla133_31210 [Planctomycetes bacterium Pla133]QDV02356.1 hypothetical protein Pla86_31200 [Planctomycetes bacterium Pla86]
MKASRTLAPLLLTAAALAGGHAASRPEVASLQQDKATLEERVLTLESKVAELSRRMEQVAADASTSRQKTDQTVDYLRRQAKQAERLKQSLDVSEEAGFTAGINPRSREVLLEAFRGVASEAQVGLPGGNAAPAPTGGRRP